MLGGMPDQRYIVCARIEDLAVPFAPARPAICSMCGHEVWLGYAVTRDVPDGRPICTPCARLNFNSEDVIEVTPEVRREAAAILRRRRH